MPGQYDAVLQLLVLLLTDLQYPLRVRQTTVHRLDLGFEGGILTLQGIVGDTGGARTTSVTVVGAWNEVKGLGKLVAWGRRNEGLIKELEERL
jgi:hypothetical protein